MIHKTVKRLPAQYTVENCEEVKFIWLDSYVQNKSHLKI